MLRCLSSRLRGSTSVGCTPVCVPLLRPEPQRLELCGRPGPAGGLGRPGAGGTPCSALGRHAAVSRLTTGWQHRVRARAAAAPRGLSGSLEVAWFPPGVNAGLAVCPSQRPSARPSSEAAEAAGQRGPGRQVPLGHGDCTRAGSAPASSRPAARNSIWVLGKSVYYGFYDY